MTQKTGISIGQSISVEEHLPENGRQVMVCGYDTSFLSGSSGAKISIGKFNPKRGWNCSISEVEYWTELPNLPINMEKNQINLGCDDSEED